MHGTGTQADDVAEIQSVSETFSNCRTVDKPLRIEAVKANIEHEGAINLHKLPSAGDGLTFRRPLVSPPL